MFRLIKFFLCGLFLLGLAGALFSPSNESPAEAEKSGPSPHEAALRSDFEYLAEQPDVAWYEVEGNNIYLGLKERKDDADLLVKGAALTGHKRLGSGFHAWGVVGAKRGWRPGDSPRAAIEHTARHGKIED